MGGNAFFLAGAAVLAAIVVALARVGRHSGGVDWAASWLCLYLGGYAAFVADTVFLGQFLYPVLGTAFIGLYVTGALRFYQIDIPLWLVVTLIAVALARSALQLLLTDGQAQVIATGLIGIGCVACAWMSWQRLEPRLGISAWFASFLLLPAAAQAAYTYGWLQQADPAIGLLTWLVVGMVVSGFQLILLLVRRSRDRLEASMIDAISRVTPTASSAERARVVQQLAGGFAHVFNNRLQLVTGYIDLLRTQPAHGHQSHGYVEQMDVALQRCIEVTQDFVDYSQVVPQRRTQTELAPLLAPIVAGRGLTLKLDQDGAWLDVDTVLFAKALEHLVENAVAAKATIVTAAVEQGDAFVSVVLTDNGEGIADAVRDRLFEPFVSTQDPAFGAGLGLAVVRNIVDAHNGHITIHNASNGRGAQVTIRLPAS